MKPIIAITHFPHVNIFKNLVEIFKKKKIEYKIITIERGNLVELVTEELGVPSFIYGIHQPTLISKFFEMIKRSFKLLMFLRNTDFDISFSMGGIEINYVTKLLSRKSLTLEDDIEYKMAFHLYAHVTDMILMPEYIEYDNTNIKKFYGFKELTYLSKEYFKEDIDIMRRYNLKTNQYIFIRLTDTKSLNYVNSELLNFIKYSKIIKYYGFDIVISIENINHHKFFDNCLILDKPEKSFHTIIFNSKFSISSGDSISRESALLGTPSIYTGSRDMAVNKWFEDREFIFNVSDYIEVKTKIFELLHSSNLDVYQHDMNRAMKLEFENPTKILYSLSNRILGEGNLIEN